jgi:hypothetical protein
MAPELVLLAVGLTLWMVGMTTAPSTVCRQAANLSLSARSGNAKGDHSIQRGSDDFHEENYGKPDK